MFQIMEAKVCTLTEEILSKLEDGIILHLGDL